MVTYWAVVAYWLERWIQDRNEDFEREFNSRWWILFQKFEILSKSYAITAVIIYCCFPVTLSRQQPKYALGASGPLAMGTNYQKKVNKLIDTKVVLNLIENIAVN